MTAASRKGAAAATGGAELRVVGADGEATAAVAVGTGGV